MSSFNTIFRFYTRNDVYPEIIDYLKGRWAAIEASSETERIFIRYMYHDGPPLKINSRDDLIKIFIRYRGLNPRTIYGSINIYNKLVRRLDTEDYDNIIYSTPVIDVDLSLNEWRLGLEVLDEVLSFLEKYNVVDSVYIKWSGRGFHIHIHEKSISIDLLKKYHPLDISYSIVEFILRGISNRIKPILDKSRDLERPLKIENKIDIQRVFTAPLSFHRLLDYVAICMKPNEVSEFDVSWAEPDKFRHNRDWRRYIEGESDDLAVKAVEEVGGYRLKIIKGVKSAKLEAVKEVEKPSRPVAVRRGKLGRFQVMALLQAARYYILKGDLEKAKSFGLNRAIFYAWAKYHKPKYGVSKYGLLRREMGITPKELPHEMVGDELAFKSKDGWFMIGDQIQRPEDYDRQIKSKIEAVISYELAWNAALEYLSKFSKKTLESQREFYKEVYEPVRDRFIELIIRHLRKSE